MDESRTPGRQRCGSGPCDVRSPRLETIASLESGFSGIAVCFESGCQLLLNDTNIQALIAAYGRDDCGRSIGMNVELYLGYIFYQKGVTESVLIRTLSEPKPPDSGTPAETIDDPVSALAHDNAAGSYDEGRRTMRSALTLPNIAKALGGDVRGGQVLAPGPGHSEHDRSLSIKLDKDAPEGFLVNSFSGDDPIICRDYVRNKLGLPDPNEKKRNGAQVMDSAQRAHLSDRERAALFARSQDAR